MRNANARPGKSYRTKKHYTFQTGALQTTVPVTPGHYAVGYQYVDTESGQETQATLLGKVGPVTFAVAQGGKASKKAA